MSNTDKTKWSKIDKYNEEAFICGVKFTKPIGYNPVNLCCSFCNNLVATIEDIEKMKQLNICESCHDLYYFPNKDKWKNGWRPNISN